MAVDTRHLEAMHESIDDALLNQVIDILGEHQVRRFSQDEFPDFERSYPVSFSDTTPIGESDYKAKVASGEIQGLSGIHTIIVPDALVGLLKRYPALGTMIYTKDPVDSNELPQYALVA